MEIRVPASGPNTTSSTDRVSTRTSAAPWQVGKKGPAASIPINPTPPARIPPTYLMALGFSVGFSLRALRAISVETATLRFCLLRPQSLLLPPFTQTVRSPPLVGIALIGCQFSFAMESNTEGGNELFRPVALEFAYHGVNSLVKYEVLFAGLILMFVYFLIITELIHRTVAAMLGSFITLGVLSALNKRPPLPEIILWIDFETVMLLFGMMIIVGVLAETGAFEFAAVKAYKYSKGQVWPLLTMLVMFSAIVSAFLDNVTTILLLTPVTIRMCNVIGLDPTPILLAEVVFSNIGGTATAVGDPPNVIIVSSKWNEVRCLFRLRAVH